MQAVVKTPHIEINIKGIIPDSLLSFLKKEYDNNYIKIFNENEDELINVIDSDWYKNIKKTITPSNNLKNYREIHKMTQKQLGEKLGDLPRQHISNMETGKRSISVNIAKKLSRIFNVSIEKFIL